MEARRRGNNAGEIFVPEEGVAVEECGRTPEVWCSRTHFKEAELTKLEKPDVTQVRKERKGHLVLTQEDKVKSPF